METYTSPRFLIFTVSYSSTSDCTGSAGRRVDGIRRAVLVVRTIATVGNYDYIYSIRFKPDGSIEALLPEISQERQLSCL